MALLMFLLALGLSYPIFLIFAYALGNLIFTRIEKAEERQKREKLIHAIKAKRIRKKQRVELSHSNAEIHRQSTGLPVLGAAVG